MLEQPLGNGYALRLPEESDADALCAVVVANQDHLTRWLPWAAGYHRDAALTFVRLARRQIGDNDGLQLLVVRDGAPVGAIGFHRLDWANRATSIGYWLAADHQGRGVITRAVRAMLHHAFGPWGLNRVEIHCAVENHRSRAIPERLGFVEEGRLRQAERVGDRWLDLVLYAMLAADWRDRSPPAR